MRCDLKVTMMVSIIICKRHRVKTRENSNWSGPRGLRCVEHYYSGRGSCSFSPWNKKDLKNKFNKFLKIEILDSEIPLFEIPDSVKQAEIHPKNRYIGRTGTYFRNYIQPKRVVIIDEILRRNGVDPDKIIEGIEVKDQLKKERDIKLSKVKDTREKVLVHGIDVLGNPMTYFMSHSMFDEPYNVERRKIQDKYKKKLAELNEKYR